MQDLLKKTEAHIKTVFTSMEGSHDWFHIDRVRRMARRLAEIEGADPDLAELIGLLHDLEDDKYSGDSEAGPKAARVWLESTGAEESVVKAVETAIRELSFKGAGVQTPMSSLEGKCAQDADRLDAIGAIGIARAFAYGGSKGRHLHDPGFQPEMHASAEAYKARGNGSTIAHFYEKLLLLKDRLNTRVAKELAEHRHQFMEAYLEEFFQEWEAKK